MLNRFIRINRRLLLMGNSATKAKNKYNKAVYDQISIKPPKGTKSQWQSEAEKHGEKLTEYITNAVKMRMESDRKQEEDALLNYFYNQDISMIERVDRSSIRKMIRSGGQCLKNAFRVETNRDVNIFLKSCTDFNAFCKRALLSHEDIEELNVFIKTYTSKREEALSKAKQLIDSLSNVSDEERYNRLLAVSLDDMNFCVAVSNCLRRVGICSIGDFKKYTEEHDLNEIRNIKKMHALDIIEKIRDYEKIYNVSLNIDFDSLIKEANSLQEYYRSVP